MTDGHPLDRPVWSALTSRLAHLARGDGAVLRIDPDFGLFVTARDFEPPTLAGVARLVPAEGMLAAIEPQALPVPGVETVVEAIAQMWAPRLGPPPPQDFEITPLTDAEGPEMLALATSPSRARSSPAPISSATSSG